MNMMVYILNFKCQNGLVYGDASAGLFCFVYYNERWDRYG